MYLRRTPAGLSFTLDRPAFIVLIRTTGEDARWHKPNGTTNSPTSPVGTHSQPGYLNGYPCQSAQHHHAPSGVNVLPGTACGSVWGE